jgi:hypothetical protein
MSASDRCPGGLIRLLALFLNFGLWLAAVTAFLRAGRYFGFWQ